MEFQGHYQSSGPRGGVCVPSCWHHISRRLRREGEWLHVAGLLLQGGVGLTSAVHLSDPNLGLVPVPLSFPSSTANSTVRRGVKAPQQPCLRKGNRKAPLPLCLWTAAPSPRLLGALSSQGAVKTQGRGRAWAGGLGGQGGKPVSMQHQARLFGNKRNRKRGHIAMGGT